MQPVLTHRKANSSNTKTAEISKIHSYITCKRSDVTDRYNMFWMSWNIILVNPRYPLTPNDHPPQQIRETKYQFMAVSGRLINFAKNSIPTLLYFLSIYY